MSTVSDSQLRSKLLDSSKLSWGAKGVMTYVLDAQRPVTLDELLAHDKQTNLDKLLGYLEELRMAGYYATGWLP